MLKLIKVVIEVSPVEVQESKAGRAQWGEYGEKKQGWRGEINKCRETQRLLSAANP